MFSNLIDLFSKEVAKFDPPNRTFIDLLCGSPGYYCVKSNVPQYLFIRVAAIFTDFTFLEYPISTTELYRKQANIFGF